MFAVKVGMQLQKIVSTIEAITSVEDEVELRRLDAALVELFSSDHPEYGLRALLGVFERFPDKDGYGVFWSILHGLESIAGYEVELIASVKRQPSEFGVLMINRIMNTGREEVEGISLKGLLAEVVSDKSNLEIVRDVAAEYIAYQCEKT